MSNFEIKLPLNLHTSDKRITNQMDLLGNQRFQLLTRLVTLQMREIELLDSGVVAGSGVALRWTQNEIQALEPRIADLERQLIDLREERYQLLNGTEAAPKVNAPELRQSA